MNRDFTDGKVHGGHEVAIRILWYIRLKFTL